MDVLGYERCRRCPELHPKMLLDRTGGLCVTCLGQISGRATQIQVRMGSAVRSVARRHRNRAHRGSKGDRTTHHNAEKARNSALSGLRALFPDVYELLLVQERQKRGLDPVALSPTARSIDLTRLEAALTVAEALADTHDGLT